MNLLFLMKYFEVGGQEVVTSVLAKALLNKDITLSLFHLILQLA